MQEIEPDLDGLNKTLAMNLLDEESMITYIDEIADVKKGLNCTSCHHPMSSLEGKEHLLCCKNCSRYVLKKRCDLEASISLTIGECVYYCS